MSVKLQTRYLLLVTAIPMLLLGQGCLSERDLSELENATALDDPLVFDDEYGNGVYWQPFSGTDYEALSIDETSFYEGESSIRVGVPGESAGLYAGGVLTSAGVRDLGAYNAMTFYARTSEASTTLDVVGYGNDNTGFSKFEANRKDIALDSGWTFVVVPIPDSSKLFAERGLFMFAEGWEYYYPEGHEMWFDEIRFAQLGNISNPRPAMGSLNRQFLVGSIATLDSVRTIFDVDGADVTVWHQPGYFDFEFSDPDVATYEDGVIKTIGAGYTEVRGSLHGVQTEGVASLTIYEAPSGPAPTPTHAAGDVISMFSAAYEDQPVDSWNPYWQWSTTQISDYYIDGDATILYSFLNFVGITFDSNPINASEMTHLHMDIFAPVGTNFSVEVVGVPGSQKLTFDADSDPAFVAGDWSSLDIPLEDFVAGADWSAVRQLVLSTDDAQLVLMDNVYWHK